MDTSLSAGSFVQDLSHIIGEVEEELQQQGLFSGKVVEPEKLVVLQTNQRKNPRSILMALNQRTISGEKLGTIEKSYQFLSDLKERQVLLEREFAVLSRAVASGACIVEPEQCKFVRSVDLLRMLSAYMSVMEKSPTLKETLDQMIKEKPITPFKKQSVGNVVDSFKELEKANVELKLRLQKFDEFMSGRSTMGCADEVALNSYLDELLSEVIDRLKYLTGEYARYKPFPENKYTITSAQNRRDDLEAFIKSNDAVIRYFEGFECMIHERIDRLEVRKILRPTNDFMMLLHSIAYLRLSDDQIPCLDGVDVNRLITEQFFGEEDYEHVMWERCNKEIRRVNGCGLAESGLEAERFWINYRGCHLDFNHCPDYRTVKKAVEKSDFPEIKSAVLALNDSAACFKRDDVNPALQISIAWYTISVFKLYYSLYSLFNLSEPSESEIRQGFQYIWNGNCSALDDIKWLIALIARAELVFKDNSRLSVSCQGCDFKAAVNKYVDPEGYEDEELAALMGDYFSIRPYRPWFDSPSREQSETTKNIKELHKDFIKVLLWHKKRKNNSCHLAQSLDIGQLWNEKYDELKELKYKPL